jgi:hypothetical protein
MGGEWKSGDVAIAEQTGVWGAARYGVKQPVVEIDPRLYGAESQEFRSRFENTISHELGHVGALNLRDEVIPGTDMTIRQKYDKFQNAKRPFGETTKDYYPEEFDELRQRMADLKREESMEHRGEAWSDRVFDAKYFTQILSERIGKRTGLSSDEVKAKAEEYRQDLESIIKKKKAEHTNPSSLKTQGEEKLPNSPKQINAENSKERTKVENHSDQDVIPVEDNNDAAAAPN